MNIAYAFTSNWFHYFLVSIFSLISNNLEEEIDFYLLVDKIENQHQKTTKILQKCFPRTRFYFIEIDETVFNEINNNKIFTKATLYRLLLPNLLLTKKVLYLDVDIIVQGSLKELYETELGSNLIAGVIDLGATSDMKKEIGLSANDPYINGGVLLIDIKKFYAEGLAEQMIDLANISTFAYPDQSILNKFCKGRTKILDEIYNYALNITVENKKESDVTRAIIVHFASYKKNWVYNLPHADIYFNWEEKWNCFKTENQIS